MRLFALTALTMALFALNSVCCRLAITLGMDSATYTMLRAASASALLAVLTLRRGGNPLAGGSWPSALFLFGYMALFSIAYTGLTAATGVLALVTGIQLASLIGAMLVGERPTAPQIIGIGIALAGLVILLLPGLEQPPLAAAALMLFSGASFVGYTVCGRHERNAQAAATGNFLRALPLACLLLLLPGSRSCPPQALLAACLGGALASGLGYTLWNIVLPRLGVTRSGAVQLSTPVLTALFGVFLLNEPVSLRLVLGATCILGGVGCALRRDGRSG